MRTAVAILIFAAVVLAGAFLFYREAKSPTVTPPEVLPTPMTSASGNIEVSVPHSGDAIVSPFFIKGRARVFESQFNYRLRDANGAVLVEGMSYAQSPDAGEFGPFSVNLAYPAPKGADGTLEVFDLSPRDGNEADMVRIPVRFGDPPPLTASSTRK